MSVDEMYAALVAGNITKEQFADWVDDRRSDAYSDGYDEANYQNAMNN